MNNHEAKKFVEAVYRDIWAAKDLNKFSEYYHPKVRCIAYQPEGIELEMDYVTIDNLAHQMAKERRDFETTIEYLLAQENHIVFALRLRWIDTKTSRVTYLRVAGEYQLEENKIKHISAISNQIWGP